MRFLAARWSPARTTLKSALVEACRETGVAPRRNWVAPSVREMWAAIEPAAIESGLSVVGRVGSEEHFGSRGEYQSVARWALHSSALRRSIVVQYDARTGRIRANLQAPELGDFRARLAMAAKHADATAQVNRVDVRDELSLAVMQHAAIAPFCRISAAGRGLWLIGIDSQEYKAVRRFLGRAGCPPALLSELAQNPRALRRAVQESRETATVRFGTRTGWVAIAEQSHAKLLEAVDDLDKR